MLRQRYLAPESLPAGITTMSRCQSIGCWLCLPLVLVAASALGFFAQEWKSGKVWPEPKVIDPGQPGGPPADAIVLFDGKDLSQWQGGEKWLIEEGVATIRGGGITTKQAFGDCQLHLEWAAPAEVK